MNGPISPTASLPTRIVAAVADLTDLAGRPPTYREISAWVGISSLGHLSFWVGKLVASGQLIQAKGSARGLLLPAACCPGCARRDREIAELRAALARGGGG